MKTITVLSKWFEEIDLAPFFFSHYSFADEIWIYLDSHSKDGSAEFISEHPNARIFWGEGDGRLNDFVCAEALTDLASRCKTDWLIYVDADEFIFPVKRKETVKEVLTEANGNLLYSHIWDMYKHTTDKDLDPNDIPIVLQRRHGDPTRKFTSVKPNVIAPNIGIQWSVGCHTIRDTQIPIMPSSFRFDGAHWQSVDFNLACKRRIKNVRERISDLNKENKWAFHNFDITEEKIAALMKCHENDPQLF